MKSSTRKRLAIARQTIRRLNPAHMQHAAGGTDDEYFLKSNWDRCYTAECASADCEVPTNTEYSKDTCYCSR